MPSQPRSAWVHLGELLVRRRIELDPRYRNRRLFTAERAVEYRIVNDIELGKRDNYEPQTIAAIEAAYHLAPGTIARVLAGGELEPRREFRSETVVSTLPVAADPALPLTTDAMEAAMAPHVEELQMRAEIARRKHPGQPLTGAMMFPLDPQAAATWDNLVALEYREPTIIRGIAALRAWESEEARTGRAASG